MSTMKAAVFDRTGELLRIRDVVRPQIGPDELLLKVAFSGVCGSDLHAADIPGMLPAGTIMGHEFTGEVVQSRSHGWRPGDRVAANPIWVCDVCAAGGRCHTGPDPVCVNGAFLGFKPELPGAYSEYVRIRASQAIRLPDHVSLRDGALMEPLAVGRHAVARCGPLEGRTVLIIGGGPIGLSVLLMAREAGAANVVVSEPDPVRRACATQMGASAVIDPTAMPLADAVVALGLAPPDIVFECVGAPGFLQQTIDVMAPRGRAIVVGVCMTEDRWMPYAALRKEASLQFVLGYTPDDFTDACDYLARKADTAAAMISQVVPLDRLPHVFDRLRTQKTLIKVMVAPNS